MAKTTENHAVPDVIGKALAVRKPRRPQRTARGAAAPAQSPAAEPSPGRSAASGESRIAGVVSLLKREQGATLEQLVQATCWQPHTTRAAPSGLRKKGHAIEKSKRGEVTCYRIAENALWCCHL